MSYPQMPINSCDQLPLSRRTGGGTGSPPARAACQLLFLQATRPADTTERHTNLDAFTPCSPTAPWLVHDDPIADGTLTPAGTEV